MKTILSLFLAAFALGAIAQTADSVATPIFTVVEELPVFPGCEEAKAGDRITCLSEKAEAFVIREMHYPTRAMQEKKEGVVYISFLINNEGKTDKVRLSRASETPGYGFEEEALRVVALLPQMVPAKQGGKPVGLTYTMAVPFKLRNATPAAPMK
ncbi:MAG: energy transducer TonB [Bacteroidia bacterium]|nr:energy transducer TonB [Bacteroidia bacterium]